MKIPYRVKIGAHWVKIKYKSDKNDLYSHAGSQRPLSNLIVLASTNIGSKQESVLFHEIIHEINWQHDLGLNEDTIASLGESIYQVLVDNKWLK